MKTNILNVTNDFLNYYEIAKDLSYEDKVKVWRELYEDKNMDIFVEALKIAHIFYQDYKLEDSYEYAFENYEKAYNKILNVSEEIDGKILNTVNRCVELFQVKDEEIESLDYVVFVGLFMADGWNTIVKGKSTTFFAIENMPVKEEVTNIFLAHEITHGFHTSLVKFNDKGSMAESLFLEGFATVASEWIIKGHEEELYLLCGAKEEENWLNKCVASFAKFKDDIKNNLENENDEYRALYFGGRSEGIPYKAGYVYGYYMIKDLLKEYSFSEMIRWDKERIKDEVRKYYDRVEII